MAAQLELFGRPAASQLQKDVLGVKGLDYLPDFLSADAECRVLEQIDELPWQNDLKRRVQHYGYRYDYKARAIDHSMYVGPLPPFAVEVAQRLLAQSLIREMPDQLIVNEYLPGQGITPHVDCEPCFKDTIVTVSLAWAYEMEFINVATQEVKSLLLERGSALILRDEARYAWRHCIRARKSDRGVPRGRRVSLTFRNVILG